MSLFKPELRYADLVEEASSRRPTLSPTWTDYNPSDPGVAVIELLAWMTEMVAYRTERIPEASKQAMLGLLRGTDPPSMVTGSDLEKALAEAVTDVRSRWRAVTPEDWERCIREDWRQHARAKHLGLASQIGRLHITPQRDLETSNAHTPKPNHLTVQVKPANQTWAFSGPLAVGKPVFSIRMDHPGTLHYQPSLGVVPSGFRVIGAGGAILGAAPGPLYHQQPFDIEVTDAGLGQTGDLNLTGDWDGGWASFTLGGVHFNHPVKGHSTVPSVLLDRTVPIRGIGAIRVMIEWPEPVELVADIIDRGGRRRCDNTGTGFLTLWAWIPPGDDGDVHAPVHLRIRSHEDDASITVRIRVDWFEKHEHDEAGSLADELWHFLDERRLLGQRHHVIFPCYQRVQVTGSVYLKPGYPTATAHPRILHALCDHFDADIGGPDGTGWPFDRPIYRTDVLACMEQVVGVDYVEDLTVTLPNAPASKLVDDGVTYGVTFEADELPFFDPHQSTLTLYERR